MLTTEQGSRLFRSLVEVNPVACADTIELVFGNWTRAQLLSIGPARRNLVWATEKLCFWKETFVKAARFMLGLAAAENETWGNNATHQFLQLYHLHLSGTQSPPEDRLLVVDEALASDTIEERRLGVKALGSALETGHFARMGGVERQGSRPPAEDWHPKTYGDVFDYHREAIARLTRVACSDANLAELARSEFAQHVRGIVSWTHRLDVVEDALKEIVKATGAYWPEALHAVREAVRYDSEGFNVDELARVKGWEQLVTPVELHDRIRLIVSIPDWVHDRDDEGNFVDTPAMNAEGLAKEMAHDEEAILESLPLLLEGEQRQGFTFGRTLACESADARAILLAGLERLKGIPTERANSSVLCGILNGMSDKAVVTDILDEVAKDDKLAHHLVELTRCSNCTAEDLGRVVAAAKEGKVTVLQVYGFSYNSVLDHIDPKVVAGFCDDVAAISVEGVGCALSILYAYCFRRKDRWEVCQGTFRRYLMSEGLLSEVSKRSAFIGVGWEEPACSLLRQEGDDTELARALAGDIVLLCSQEEFPYHSEYHVRKVLNVLLERHFSVAWPVFGSVLLSEGWRVGFHLGHILENTHRKAKAEGSLHNAPLADLIEWCREHSPKGARLVARFMPTLTEKNGGSLGWDGIAQSMIDEFGEDEEFLDNTFGNLNTFVWTGSIVPYYEAVRAMMVEMERHPLPSVRKWSQTNISWLDRQIEEEKKKEQEREFGIY